MFPYDETIISCPYSPLELLRRARANLSETTWRKGEWVAEGGRGCALGQILLTYMSPGEIRRPIGYFKSPGAPREAMMALGRAILEMRYPKSCDFRWDDGDHLGNLVAQTNDAPGTDFPYIVEMYDRAITLITQQSVRLDPVLDAPSPPPADAMEEEFAAITAPSPIYFEVFAKELIAL